MSDYFLTIFLMLFEIKGMKNISYEVKGIRERSGQMKETGKGEEGKKQNRKEQNKT